MFAIGNHFCIVFKFLLPKHIYKYFQMFPFQSKMERLNSLRRIAFQVTQSLIVLSSLNIIHADIKPENILFTDASRKNVKLIDLGNAIYCVHKEMSLYFDSFELQTVFYRAPEVMFGLPFVYQIDMWSLACVLAELYLGEPLFLATSKEEILEQIHSLLGPLPLSPYQEGKYFTDFKKYVSRNSLVHGHCEKVVNVMKKLKSTDFIFADFVTKLLAFDPCLRLTPMDALRHPFLAPECASGFISSHGNFSQAESGYPSVLLTSETYPYHPFIDEKIKKLHFSDLELLRVGTCRKPASHNVLKVLPVNYQADHSEDVDESSLNTDDQSEGPFNESCYALNTRVSRSDHCRRDPSRKRQRRFFIRGQSKAPRTSQEELSCSLASTEKYVDNNAVFDDGRTGYSCEKSNKIIAKRGRKRSALYCRPSWLKATKKILPIINTKTKSKCTGAKITSRVCSGSVDKEYAASFSQLEKGSNGESGDNHDGIAL
ncbi:uncharacterized protein LOC124455275 [Xenia sp. Carnegie-2017]|uniref:uncharacterized protein LOC124455275 n=1 Tax=Xenia sp. Carnegie-2017 TaxID=2897299 RepID=UPI001F04F627|nr:uncharacterized protein LOC124455275 [Xenia sp. Carnegie-2017]